MATQLSDNISRKSEQTQANYRTAAFIIRLTRIHFFGCKTASESSLNFLQKFFGKRTIADSFAQYFKGVTVTGFTGGALAAPMPNAKPDPSFVHKKGDPVWFITWGSIRTYKYEK